MNSQCFCRYASIIPLTWELSCSNKSSGKGSSGSSDPQSERMSSSSSVSNSEPKSECGGGADK